MSWQLQEDVACVSEVLSDLDTICRGLEHEIPLASWRILNCFFLGGGGGGEGCYIMVQYHLQYQTAKQCTTTQHGALQISTHTIKTQVNYVQVQARQ